MSIFTLTEMLPVEINKHQCNLCEYKTSKKQTLGAHVRGVHEGVNFECDQCDYKAFFRSSRYNHKKAKLRFKISIIKS